MDLQELSEQKGIMEEALRIVENPDTWAQGALAFDDRGMRCDPLSENAVRWCAAGACYKAVGIQQAEMGWLTQITSYVQPLDVIAARVTGCMSIVAVNDAPTLDWLLKHGDAANAGVSLYGREAVVAIFKEYIAQLQTQIDNLQPTPSEFEIPRKEREMA